jgi:hypothetical protein
LLASLEGLNALELDEDLLLLFDDEPGSPFNFDKLHALTINAVMTSNIADNLKPTISGIVSSSLLIGA